jgi:hypothetical protein
MVVSFTGWALAACHVDRWDSVLTGTIHEINVHVHQDLRDAYLDRSLEAILAHYSVSDQDEAALRESKQAILGLYQRIDRAEVILCPPTQFDQPAVGDVTLHTKTRLHGVTPEGGYLQYSERAQIVVDVRDRPLITRERVLSQAEVARSERNFEDATLSAGIRMVHEPAWLEAKSPIVENVSLGGGAAVADYDGDGWEDLYLVNGSHDRLYRNLGDGTFEDATLAAGLGGNDKDGQAAVFGDLDNDGHADLVVTNLMGAMQMFHNQGDGTFVERTEQAGLPRFKYENSMSLLDYDLDGDLDVFSVGGGELYAEAPYPLHEAENGTPNHLLRNNGDWTFTDVSDSSGVGGHQWGLSCASTDYDNDGDPDIYVANDFGFNSLYQNQGDGSFREVGQETGAGDRGAGMGCIFGDYDNDGNIDIYSCNMYSNSRWIVFHDDYPLPVPWYFLIFRERIHYILDEMTRGNSMLRNQGDGTFVDVSDKLEVRDTDWAWGCAFLDHDNDGDLDLYAVNGMVSGEEKDDL